jgi:hypothetical protein
MIKGTFTSVWDGDELITTPATLDETTGEVITESVDVDGLYLNSLDREFFTDEEENDYEVCTECHNHILKTVMKNGVGKTLYEAQVCTDPECDNQ